MVEAHRHQSRTQTAAREAATGERNRGRRIDRTPTATSRPPRPHPDHRHHQNRRGARGRPTARPGHGRGTHRRRRNAQGRGKHHNQAALVAVLFLQGGILVDFTRIAFISLVYRTPLFFYLYFHILHIVENLVNILWNTSVFFCFARGGCVGDIVTPCPGRYFDFALWSRCFFKVGYSLHALITPSEQK